MLPIAGIQKLSLVDYPGHLCAILFLQGCNMRCPFCHNAVLVPCEYEPDWVYSRRWEEVLEYLSHRRNFLEGVCITGGEPTLHRDLPEGIQILRSLGYKIKLDTNGTNPVMVESLLRENQIDYVAMDIKTSLDRYVELGVSNPVLITNIRKTIKVIMDLAPDYEFRTTMVPGLIEEEDFVKILEEIRGARRYVLQAYRPEYVLDSEKAPPNSIAPERLSKYVEMASGKVNEILARGYGGVKIGVVKCGG